MTKKKYICKCCGNEYFSYKEKSNYCSHDCRIKDNTFYHLCEYCGKEVRVGRAIHEKYKSGEKKHLYCSKECTDKAHTTKVKKICEQCGQEYYIGKSFSDIQRFCSKECYSMHRSKTHKIIKKICPTCGNGFYTYHKNQIYCSKKCRGVSDRLRIKCKCETCGKNFERIYSEVDKNKRHYCSNECRLEGIRWSVSDIDILRNNYGTIQINDIQDMLSKHYSIKAIRSRAKDFGFAKSRLWSNEEESILLQYYSELPINEVMNMLPKRTTCSILGKAKILGIVSYFFKTKIYTDEEVKYLESSYLDKTDDELASVLHRSPGAVHQKLYLMGLKRPFEINKSGYSDLIEYTRSRIRVWTKEVKEYFNYTCVLSGSRSNIVVHHCRGFNILFEETMDMLEFPTYDYFEQYSDDELNLFIGKFLQLQAYYNEFVCITDSIHKLFHKEYGYGYNTEEQWKEFVQKYNNGYYKNIA